MQELKFDHRLLFSNPITYRATNGTPIEFSEALIASDSRAINNQDVRTNTPFFVDTDQEVQVYTSPARTMEDNITASEHRLVSVTRGHQDIASLGYF